MAKLPPCFKRIYLASNIAAAHICIVQWNAWQWLIVIKKHGGFQVSLTAVGGNLDIRNPSRHPQLSQLNLFLLSFCSKLFKTLNAMLIPAADWLWHIFSYCYSGRPRRTEGFWFTKAFMHGYRLKTKKKRSQPAIAAILKTNLAS